MGWSWNDFCVGSQQVRLNSTKPWIPCSCKFVCCGHRTIHPSKELVSVKAKILAACAIFSGLFWGCDSSGSTGAGGGGGVATLDSLPLSKDVKDTMNGAAIGYRLAVQKDSVYAISLALLTDFELIQKAGYNPFLRLSILASDKDSVLVSIDGTSNDFSPSTRIVAPASGYLRIKVGGVDRDGLCSFNLRVDPLDRYETDDIAEKAVLVPTDSSYTYRTIVDAIWDVDWIRFRTIPGSVYELILTDSRAKATIVRSDKATPLTTQETTKGLVFRFMALDTLSYASFGNESNSSVFGTVLSEEDFAYGVAVAEKTGDTFEPDNSVKAALLLRASGAEQLRTASMKDDDFVRLGVVANKAYQANFQSDVALLVDVLLADSSRIVNQWKITAGINFVRKTFETRSEDSLVLRIRPESDLPGYYNVSLIEISGDGYEPDSISAVQAVLSVDNQFGSRFLSNGDVDWFLFQADSGNTYTISHDAPQIDSMSGSLWTSDSNQVTSETFRRTAKSTFVFVCRKSGTYHYAASLTEPSSDPLEYSTILTRSAAIPAWFSVADRFEPDNGVSTASKLAADSAEVLHSVLVGDADWSRIDVDSGRTYIVEVANTGLASIAFAMFTADSVRIDSQSSIAAGKVSRRLSTVRKAGELLVRVGSIDSASNYSVRAWAVAVDSSEPDNEISQARELSIGAKALVRTLDGSPDWFKVHLDSAERYIFDFARQDNGGCGVNLAIYGQDSNTVLASVLADARADFQLPYSALRGGDFHIKAWAGSGCNDRTVPYALSARRDPEDRYESDNTLATAKSIATDSSVQKRTVSADNDDLIRIDLDSGTTYELRVASLDSRQRIDVMVLRADSSLLDENFGVNALRFTFSGRRRTTYYVKVGSSDGAKMPFPYAIAVKGSTVAKEVKLVDGPILLEGDGVRMPVAFVMGDSMEVKFSFKDGLSYDLNLSSDVDLRYSAYQEGFQSSTSQGLIAANSGMGLKWGVVSKANHRVVLKGKKGLLVKLDATLKAN